MPEKQSENERQGNETAAESPPAERGSIRVDFARRRRLLETLGGNNVNYCYQCGACVGDCPSARFYPAFNPREIMLTALLGGLDQLLAPDSIIWKCSNCYNCYERCPQDVRPVEVIIALKNLATEDGTAPQEVQDTYEMICRTGRSAPVIEGVQMRRERMGLARIEEVDLTELAIILRPEESDQSPPDSRNDAPGSANETQEPRQEEGKD